MEEDKEDSLACTSEVTCTTSLTLKAKLILYKVCISSYATDQELEKLQKQFMKISKKKASITQQKMKEAIEKKLLSYGDLSEETKEELMLHLTSNSLYSLTDYLQSAIALEKY